MYELTVNGQVAQFNFGMGFLREMNKKVTVPVEGMRGVTQNVGFRYSVARIIDGDVEALAEVLDTANRGCNPRLSKEAIDSFIDDENTDIDELFEKTLGFLETANATKKIVREILDAVAKEKAKQEAKEKAMMAEMA